MKWLLLICAILVQVFGAMPCSDEKAATESHYSISSSCSDHHSPGADHCSPFCSCSCCGTSVARFGEASQLISLSVSTKKQDLHRPSNWGMVVLPVWQPPQLL